MIGIERAGAVTTIELQRPERRNALNSALGDALREAIQQGSFQPGKRLREGEIAEWLGMSVLG